MQPTVQNRLCLFVRILYLNFLIFVCVGANKMGVDDDDLYLFLHKQQPAQRYIPIGYVPPGIKESTCDDASSFNHRQCPLIQMTDTDVTSLPEYHNMDPSRLYVMILTSPPSLSLSRPWAGLGVRWPSQSTPWLKGCQSSSHYLSTLSVSLDTKI